jgi:hypothetical protein
MKIQDVKTKQIYHAPIEAARRAVDAGLAVPVFPPDPVYPYNTKWVVVLTADGLNPIINYSCGCGAHGNMCGPTAHKTQRVGHCGTQEAPPPHIADQYEKLLKKKRAHDERTRNSENTGKLQALRSRP